MMSRPDGSALDAFYTPNMRDFFSELLSILNGSQQEDPRFLTSKHLHEYFGPVIKMRPFESWSCSHEREPRLTLAGAFGSRIPAWNILDSALSSYSGNSRGERIETMIRLLEQAFRYLHIMRIAKKASKEFEEVGFIFDPEKIICTSEVLAQDAGKKNLESALGLIRSVVQGFNRVCGEGNIPVMASEEELRAFCRDHPQETFLFLSPGFGLSE